MRGFEKKQFLMSPSLLAYKRFITEDKNCITYSAQGVFSYDIQFLLEILMSGKVDVD